MAAYGAQLKQGKSKEEAVQYLRDLFANVSVQDKSARESLQTFAAGKGDVLIAYENEAITAQQAGQPLEYVIPDQTILIENPIAVTKDAPEQAQAFVDFLRTPEAQKVFAEKGYRSILPDVARRGALPDAAHPVHDRRPRRLGRGHVRVLRPRGRDLRGHPTRTGGAHRMKARIVAVLAAALVLIPAASAQPARGTDTKLTLVAYSTPREAYAKLIPAFQKTAAGKDVSFSQSYGASGEQARAVINGLSADVIMLSLEPDMTELVEPGLVSKGWNRGFYKGMVTNSVVVFVVRDGNPKRIKTWNDLLKSGVEVITPNPFTSGGARWNVMAAYGAWRKNGKTHKQAVANLEKLFRHVTVQDKSARESLQTFVAGKGDVLLAYENEAALARKNGQPVQYVIPRSTILIENPIAVVNKTSHSREAYAFLNFLRDARGAGDLRGELLSARREERGPQVHAAVPARGRPSSRSTSSASAVGRRCSATSSTCAAGSSPRSSGRWVATLAADAGTVALPRPVDRSAALSANVARGLVTAYLGLIVVLPLAAVVWRSTREGGATFWDSITAPDAVAALKLTLLAALAVALVNAVVGTLIAWVLVRDSFRGQNLVNAVIDLPFALPTIVAGVTLLALYGPLSPVGVNAAYTRWAILLALLFVTLPFVVRTVQPVLLELDTEMEEAASSLGAGRLATFRRIVFPNLLPGILSGVALAFARAVGEFGSVVLISGNLPFKTQVSSVYIFGQIESDNVTGAAAVSVVLLAISFAVLLGIGGIRRLCDEARPMKYALRFVALGYLAAVLWGRWRSSSTARSSTASTRSGRR